MKGQMKSCKYKREKLKNIKNIRREEKRREEERRA